MNLNFWRWNHSKFNNFRSVGPKIVKQQTWTLPCQGLPLVPKVEQGGTLWLQRVTVSWGYLFVELWKRFFFLISKNCQIILIKVLVGSQKYRRMVRFLNFPYFKKKIWLNLSKDDCEIFFFFVGKWQKFVPTKKRTHWSLVRYQTYLSLNWLSKGCSIG